jgi:SAM-dependent methyltransferase
MTFDRQKYYNQDYKKIMNQGLIGMFSRFIHAHIDWKWRKQELGTVLELGAGNGQHFKWCKLKFQRYVEVDLRQLDRLEDVKISKSPDRLICDATYLDLVEADQFDVVIATCLLAHLDHPEVALSNWRRVAKKPGGQLCIYVPCDPGLLLRALRQFTTKRKFIKLGYDHAYQHWTEHRNHFPLMDTLIRHVFAEDKVTREFFPAFLKSWNLNIYCLYRITIN